MGNNINELLLTELENLEKEPEIRREAMKKLRSHIKDLDPKFIHIFLARAYEIKDLGSPSGECILFLLDILVRTHGYDIVPHIDKIMGIIVQTLSSSLGSFTLHQSSSKVGSAILRYGINPLMSESEKARIVFSICKPLSNLLMSSHESAASGSAIYLQALVESDNWKFASDSVVNEICLKVSSALEESQTQTTNHMGLIMALSQHNPLIIDAYSRLLICCGIQILTCEVNDKLNSQKRLSAIKMINMLMKCVDSRSISSEIDKVIDVMEKCQCDSAPFVSGAAFEAYQTAKTVAQQHESLINSSPFVSPNSKSNSNSSNRSNVDELAVEESPFTTGQSSSNVDMGGFRRFWKNSLVENGCGSESGSSCNNPLRSFAESRNGEVRGTQTMDTLAALADPMCNSPQNSRPSFDDDIDDDVNIYSTPRKPNNRIQNSSKTTAEDRERQNSGMILSPRSIQYEQNQIMELNNNETAEEKDDCKDKNGVCVLKEKQRGCGRTLVFFISCFLVVFVAFILSNVWIDEDESVYFVPT